MQLDEHYSLDNSEQQWTLRYSKTYTDKDGKSVTSKNEYFFSRMSDALNSYIDKKLKASETVSDAIADLLFTLIDLKNCGFTHNPKK